MIDFRKLPKGISITFIFIISLTVLNHYFFWNIIKIEDLIKEDIYYAWKEGVNIVDGNNPYARTLLGNLRDNDKYPTYLPFVYIFSAITNKLGFNTFEEFINIWRPLSLLMHLITGILVFNIYIKKGFYNLAIISSIILLLGRWSNYIIKVQHIEFVTVAFLISSILIIQKKPLISGILYGISISLKHIGILFLPVLLIKLGKSTRNKKSFSLKKAQKKYLLGFISQILILVLPFIISSPKGFLASMIFPITRFAASHGIATGINSLLLGLDGSKVIAYLLIFYIYYISLKTKIGVFSSSLFILIVYLQFNTIIFTQYYYWLITFILLFISEALPSIKISESKEVK